MDRPIKFRFWCPAAKAFVQDYRYSGRVEELFEKDKMLIPQQYIGIKDKNKVEIYEGDIVRYSIKSTSEPGEYLADWEGEVFWDEEKAMFCFCVEYGFNIVDGIDIKTLEVIGHVNEDRGVTEDLSPLDPPN